MYTSSATYGILIYLDYYNNIIIITKNKQVRAVLNEIILVDLLVFTENFRGGDIWLFWPTAKISMDIGRPGFKPVKIRSLFHSEVDVWLML